MLYNNIEIALIQEHNVKSLNSLEYLAKFYKIFLNPTICIKGGTAIMITKKLDVAIENVYLHPSSRLLKVDMKIQDKGFHIFCVYAHSGSNHNKEREEFFEQEVLPLLQNISNKVIIGGDWNCIISNKDSSNPDNSNFSNALKNIVNCLTLKDVHNYVTIKQKMSQCFNW